MSHHHHHHGHAHAHGTETNRIGWAFFLNVGFTCIEFVGGILTNSTAILADAVHDLGDSLSIGLAWLLAKLSGKRADEVFSYGYRRFSLLGAMINGLILIIGSAWVIYESIPRLFEPEMPMAEGMLVLAIFGVVVNGYGAYKLSHGKTLNERMLNWHLLEDVLGWVAVLIVALILMFFDWPILDPILSIGFTLFILFNVARNIRATIRIFLQATPDTQLYQDIRSALLSLEDVADVHHLYLWSLDGEHHVLTAHLDLDVAISFTAQQALKLQIAERLKTFELAHTTIEFEFADEVCRDC